MDNGITPLGLVGLPERTPDEAASATVRVVMGGQVRSLPVLPIRANRDWTTLFTGEVDKTIGGLGALESLDTAAAHMAGAVDTMIELLVSYDRTGALGGREWIEDNATPGEVYEAFKAVAAAAFPFGLDLVKALPELRAVMLREMVRDSLQRMSASRQPTAGRRTKSKTT